MPQDYHIEFFVSKEADSASNNNQLNLIQKFLTSKHTSKDNLAEEIIKERTRFQKTTIDQTLSLIKEREGTRERNLASIASESIGFQSQLYVYRCHIYPINPDNKRKGNLERAISELENRRRQEEVDCWKDTLRLWQELLKIAAEYRATVRKAKILLCTE